MKYSELNLSSNFPYPQNDIDPAKKDAAWCMQYAKAAYYDFNWNYPKGIFSSNNGDYQKNRLYALGKQPVVQYQKWLGLDQSNNDTWMSVDWSIRPIISGYRDKVISQLLKDDYSIVATPIDAQAKGEINNYYNMMKAKLLVRQQIIQKSPELASHPLISMQSGEPLDLEELEMRVALGEQFNRAMDAELAIELGFYENDYRAFLKMIYEDLFDYGVAGYFNKLGEDNKAKFRRVDPENVIVSYSSDPYFKNIVHAGEVIPVSLIDLAMKKDDDGNPLFTEADLQEFAGSIAGKWGNPNANAIGMGNAQWLKPYDKFKCNVLEIYFLSYNDNSYYIGQDKNGNSDFRKSDYGRGKKSEKYLRKRVEYVYKCSWIIGTDKVYDWGMDYDQPRSPDPNKIASTQLPHKFIATNFYQMKAQSFMDKLVPYGDEYQLTMLKIQNWKNRAIPSGWWINLDSLENVALNKGGQNMSPKQLIQMLVETGIMVGRSRDAITGQPLFQNSSPIVPMQNSVMAELAGFYNDLLRIVGDIERMVGFNDVTAGNPNPKTLVPGYEIATQNTNNALYPLAASAEWLTERLAEDVLVRMKQGIKRGEISGFAPYKGALGVNTLRFISVDPQISDREYGIELQKKSTEQEKEWILGQLQNDIANQLLDVSDAILIIETHNAKQAMQLLAARVKKAKQQVQQNAMQQQAQAIQGNQQQTQMSQQAQMAILQMELQSKERIAAAQIQADLQKKQMEVEANKEIALTKAMATTESSSKEGQAKILSSAIQGEYNISKAHVQGEKLKEKQQIANEKPANQIAE